MNPAVYNPSQVYNRSQNLTNQTSNRLFNRNYPKAPLDASSLSHLYQTNQQIHFQPNYPVYYQSSYRPSNQPKPSIYTLPQSQIQSRNGLYSSTTSNFYQVNPYTTLHSPILSNSGIGISSKGLETILIAILILVALDLVVIRPKKHP